MINENAEFKYYNALSKITLAVIEDDIEKGLNVIVEQLIESLGIHRCVIAKVIEHEGIYKFVAGVAKLGPAHTLYTDYLIAEHGIIAHVVEKQLIDYVPEVARDDRLDPSMKSYLVNGGIKSILFVPILINGKVKFIIILDTVGEQKEFTETEIDFVNNVAKIIMRLKIKEQKVKHDNRLSMAGWMRAAITHEIRNPITSIGGFARRAKKILEQPELDISKLRECLDVCVNEVMKIELALNILDGQSNFLSSAPERVNLKQFIREILGRAEIATCRDKVKIRFTSQGVIPSLMLDKQKLRVVLRNLLTNAVEHAQTSDCSIGISITLRRAKQFVEIIVCNPGRLPDSPEQVFEPFYTTVPNGAGLGLTVAKSIVKSCHPNASIEANQKGDLVEFTVSLPFALALNN